LLQGEEVVTVAIPEMPRPNDAELSQLGLAVGHPLPPSYVSFVNHHDGATPSGNSLVTSANEISVSRFVSVREALNLNESIDGFPISVIPFAEDDCGNYFYVKPYSGAVYFWDHELEDADEKVANDVAEFIEKLTSFDPETVTLKPGQVRSVWVDPTFKPEF
jgi:hypothetical protein